MAPAKIHDSQMLPMLLGSEDRDDYARADSADAGKCFEDIANIVGFESCIREISGCNHPLSQEAKYRNRDKPAIRACVIHIFGCMTMFKTGKMTKKIGFERDKALYGPKNLAFNVLRCLLRADLACAHA